MDRIIDFTVFSLENYKQAHHMNVEVTKLNIISY